MGIQRSMAESPSGLIHLIHVLPPSSYGPERGITRCGSHVDYQTWTRIAMYDRQMFGKGLSTIRKMIDSANLCERCFK
jgi:hypothetical protein